MHKPPVKLQINSVLTSPQSSFIPNKLEAQAHAQAELMLQTGGKDIIGPFIISYFAANIEQPANIPRVTYPAQNEVKSKLHKKASNIF